MFQLNLPSTWDVITKYTANNFNRRYIQMWFAGPSMGNSADADQMSPGVALQYAGREGSMNFVLAWCEKLRVKD